MIVAEALSKAILELPVRRGLPDPKREALFLLAAAWQVDEVWLRIRPNEAVPAEIGALFFHWVKRRGAGEPAEHIVGRCSFWGRTFSVTPSVLIPRPESELMIEAALEADLRRHARVLDVGTGSGCLAISLALERVDFRVNGIDRSLASIGVARQNAADHKADVTWACSDLCSSCRPGYDLVVANLPYIPTPWLASLGLELSYEPVGALDGGDDGLRLISPLISDLKRILSDGGLCFLELAEGQAAAVEQMALEQGLQPVGRRRDVGGCDRIVILEKSELRG